MLTETNFRSKNKCLQTVEQRFPEENLGDFAVISDT